MTTRPRRLALALTALGVIAAAIAAAISEASRAAVGNQPAAAPVQGIVYRSL